MANNVNKPIHVDPNDLGNGGNIDNNLNQVPLEDLNIIVELTAQRRGRSVISDNGHAFSNSTSGSELIIPNGTIMGDSKALTTSYTQVSTTFNKSGDNVEGLGLTDINIEFNSSYAPMITISMVDVRGSSVFASGNDSNYNIFFDLPYPIFRLKIQGYYGKAVTYCLHLLKFTTKFNSQTGNFDIKCNFIGYTYAFLSDMLMGYIRGNVYTDIGSQKFKEVQDEYKRKNQSSTNSNGELVPFELPTIDEYFDDLKTLNTDFEKMKRDDETAKKISATQDKKSQLSKIRDSITVHNRELTSGDYGNTFSISAYGIYKKVKKSVPQEIKDNHNKFVLHTLADSIKEYNSGNIDNSLKITDNDIKLGLYFHSKIDSNMDDTNKKYYQELIELTKSKGQNITPYCYASKILLNKIDKIDGELTQSLKDLEVELGKKMGDVALNKIHFKPTIRNVISLLGGHVDAFYRTIRQVSINAEKIWINKSNGNANKMKNKSPDAHNGDVVNAWPEYVESGSDGKNYDAWIGNVLPDSDEAQYIEQLLDGLIAVKKHDNDLSELLNGYGTDSWYKVNPLEVFANTNPYQTDYIRNGNVDQIIKVVLDRMFIFFNQTAKHLTKNEIIGMAKLEANNLFKGIEKVKQPKMYKHIDTSDLLLPINIINKYSKENDDLEIKRPYLKTNNTGYYYYNYRSDGYIPLTDDLNSKDISTSDTRIIVGGYVSPVKESWNESDNNCTFIKNDDRSDTYIKIVDYVEPERLPSYGTKILEENKLEEVLPYTKYLNENSIDSEERNTPGWSLFSNEFGCQTFNKLETASGEGVIKQIQSPIFFYRNDKKEDFTFSQLTDNPITEYGHYDNRINGTPYEFLGDCPHNNKHCKPGKLFKVYDINSYIKINPDFNGLGGDYTDPYLIKYLPNLHDLLSDNKSNLPTINGDNFYTPGFLFNLTDFSSVNNLYEYDLFGSEFYYAQDKISRGFLFLHSLPLIQAYREGLFYDTVDSKAFNQNNETPGLLSNYIIQGLLSERASIFELPYTWVLFLGGLLWRLSESTDPIKFKNGSHYYLPLMTDFNTPEKNEYLTITVDNATLYGYNPVYSSLQFSYDSDGDDIKKLKVESNICNLPKQVKDIFINEFKDWVNTSWSNLQEQLEIVETYSEFIDRYNNWDNISGGTISPSDYYNTFNKENYDSIWACINIGDSKNFYLELKKNTKLQKDLYELITKTKIIVNGSWRIWNVYSQDGEASGNRYVNSTNDDLLETISEGDFTNYLNAFHDEFRDLVDKSIKDGVNEYKEIEQQLFQTIDNDAIKLSLYRSIKSIYEKWISGSDYTDKNGKTKKKSCVIDEHGNIIDTFKFLDRDFEDIGDKFLINPNDLMKNTLGDMNQSFYDVISRILTDNYFNFIPLPNYINYKTEEGLKQAFKPFTFLDDSLDKTNENGPSFVCVYSGQKSIHLNMGPNGKYPDDGVNVVKGSSNSNFGSAPIFDVNYGQQNQNYFKDISLDQEEFSETQESLKIIDDIGNRGAENNKSTIGQNLYNIYNTRSYSCEVEMLGDAMIQPMMYFQLNNIPMFRGAYLIIKVSHSIKPNSMSTRFKGVRIKSTKTPLIEEYQLYMNIFGSIPTNGDYTDSTIAPTGNVDSDDVKTNGKFNFGNPVDEVRVTSAYGSRIFGGKHEFHPGVDLGEKGVTQFKSNVYAVANGVISTCKMDPGGYGLYITIRHEPLDNGKIYYSLYGHLYDLPSTLLDISGTTNGGVKESTIDINLLSSIVGKRVKKGDTIGLLGGVHNKHLINGIDTAGKSTDLHLHFGMYDGGTTGNGTWISPKKPSVDPMKLIEAGFNNNTTYKSNQTPKE